MRRRGLLLAVGLTTVLVAASAATAQGPGQPHYWPHRTFYIPVAAERLDPKPTHLQLYSSLARGKWKAGPKLPIDGLQDIGDGKKGFQFTADQDGEYEFSVQHWYKDEARPRTADELPVELSVVIDTTPPVVRVEATANGVRWQATDANIDPQGVTLEAKWPQWTKYQTVPDATKQPARFKPADGYAWQLQPGQTLEVRVVARDRAGHEGLSQVVRVPGDGLAAPRVTPDWPPGASTALPRDPLREPPGGTGSPRARIDYVNGKDITVEYTVQRMGRSGIKAARLYVLNDRNGRGWEPAGDFKVDLQPDRRDQTLALKYTAPDDGTYGFYVALESGAGVKGDPPQKDAPPMQYVVVDTQAPFVKITDVRVSPGGARGPLVEIAWETADQNLMATPITLEYSVDKDAAQWKTIKHLLAPGTEQANAVGDRRFVGHHAWEVPDENLWKFHVRIRAVDQATNAGTDQWANEVIVDLEKPAAGIVGVRGGSAPGAAPSSPSPTPPAARPTPRPTRSDDPPAARPPAPVEPTPPSVVPPVAPSTTPGGTKPPVPALPALPPS